jgi:hypothetical protein
LLDLGRPGKRTADERLSLALAKRGSRRRRRVHCCSSSRAVIFTAPIGSSRTPALAERNSGTRLGPVASSTPSDASVRTPHPGTEVEDVIGRDPRLRQPASHQQHAQMPRVRAIVLCAPDVHSTCHLCVDCARRPAYRVITHPKEVI